MTKSQRWLVHITSKAVLWVHVLGAALALATSASAIATTDWRGVPKGAFIGPATPSAGDGAPQLWPSNVLMSTGAPPLESLGDNVIRFSSSPLRSKLTYIVEAHRVGVGPAAGTVTTFALGEIRWEQVSVRHFRLTAADFQTLTATVDDLMKERLPIIDDKDEVIACLDGAFFLTERMRDGKKSWLEGDYGPNYTIAKALIAAASEPTLDPAPPHYCGDR